MEGIIMSRKELAAFPSTNPQVIENLILLKNTDDTIYKQRLSSLGVRYTENIPSFYKIHFLNTEGIVVGSSHPDKYIGSDWSNHEAFLVAKQGKKYLDGAHLDEEGRFNLFLSSPIFYQDSLIGITIIDRISEEILSISNDYSGLRNTGETVIAKIYPDSILFLTSLRHDPDAGLKRYLSPSDSNTAAYKIVYSRTDTLVFANDYRGVPVIAWGRFIEDAGWIIITKIDVAEAMEPVNRLIKLLIVFNFFAILISLIVAFVAGSYYSKPFESLSYTAKKFKEGNYAARANTKTGLVELNYLADSFNSMADTIEKKIEQLDRYAHVISHDLKAPLNNSESIVHIFETEYNNKPLDQQGISILNMLKVSLADMREMTTNLLITAKEKIKRKEYIDMVEVTNEVVSMLKPESRFHIFIKHDLPVVKVHKVSIKQIMQNLLSNAIKFNNKQEPIIKIGCQENDKEYIIFVTDNGMGIRQEKLNNLFKTYETAHDLKNVDSHGLGLSIVKQLVEEQGGRVWVESTEDKETRFYFTVPK